MSTLNWQITLGTLSSLVEKNTKMGYFQGQTCSKGLFHCVIHSDRRGYHTKLSFYQNENKFDEQISSVSSKKPSFKTLMRLQVQCNFRQTLINRHPIMEG